jgi:hypothetical protein
MVFQNYMIFAHKNPLQLGRLITALDSEYAWFFIHIDRSINQVPFEEVLKCHPRVSFLEEKDRLNTRWGHMNMVKATLHSIRYVIDAGHGGVGILMSGLDYPVKSRKHIDTFLTDHKDKCLIETQQLLKGNGEGDIYTTRLNYYRINLSDNYICFPSVFDPAFYKKRRVHDIYRVVKYGRLSSLVRIFSRRKHPVNIVPFWGSQWWVLPVGVMEKAMEFVDNTPSFIDYHENSLLPDEIFFQTVLKHISGSGPQSLEFSSRCMFMKWQPDAASPNFLGSKDLKEIMSLPDHFLFARKFDITLDPEILDLIDKAVSQAVSFENKIS